MMCKYVHATSGRAVQVPNRGSQKNFSELCNDLQRDSSKGGLLAYWLAPTATLCFQLAYKKSPLLITEDKSFCFGIRGGRLGGSHIEPSDSAWSGPVAFPNEV